jgi:hypothetical protein
MNTFQNIKKTPGNDSNFLEVASAKHYIVVIKRPSFLNVESREVAAIHVPGMGFSENKYC